MDSTKLLQMLVEQIVKEPDHSVAAFFLGSDAPKSLIESIEAKGYRVVAGSYDNLVYSPMHWKVMTWSSAKRIVSSAKTMPKQGLLEAGVDFPYSHVIIPKSSKAKSTLRKLFGIPKGSTFAQLAEASGMTRREFLSKAAKLAGATKAFGPLGIGSKLGATTAIKSDGALAAANWLGRELMYAAAKKMVYDRWNKYKNEFLKADPFASQNEFKQLEKIMDEIDLDKIGDPNVFNPFDSFKMTPGSIQIDSDISEDIFITEYGDWDPEYENKKKVDDTEQSDDHTRKNDKALDDFDGFDDLQVKRDKSEDQPWMGENRNRKFDIAIPTVKHLSKAWPDKQSWRNEVFKILD